MIANTQVILSRDLSEAYAATNPANAILYVQPFDEGLVRAVRNMPEVLEAQGGRSFWVRLKAGPDEWLNFQLFAISDYEGIRINKVWPESGAWPPQRREVLLERSSLAPAKVDVGDTILIELPNGQQRELRIAGLVHDLGQVPPIFWSGVHGYVTFDTLEWLGGPRNYNR
jgi:putative ABC transport system permease protein